MGRRKPHRRSKQERIARREARRRAADQRLADLDRQIARLDARIEALTPPLPERVSLAIASGFDAIRLRWLTDRIARWLGWEVDDAGGGDLDGGGDGGDFGL